MAVYRRRLSLPHGRGFVVERSGLAVAGTAAALSLLIGFAITSQARVVLLALLGIGVATSFLVLFHILSVRSTRLVALFSPATYIVIVLITLALSQLRSPLKSAYGATSALNYSMFAVYLIVFGVGVAVAALFQATMRNVSERRLSIDDNWLRALFAIAFLAQAAKFVDIGHIPLLSDPTSRYSLGLGGFADYPSRLLAPLALLFFWKALDHPSRKGDRVAVVVALALNLLFLQRQEVVNVGLGCVLVWGMKRRINARTLLVTIMGVIVLSYGVIGVGAMIRLGTSTISTSASRGALPLWIIHREFTAPYALGQYVVDRIGPGALHGTYSFGTYAAIFGSDATTGAPLIQNEFTAASTAQTVGAPYSYYLDFGMVGVALIGFGSGLITAWMYGRMRRRQDDPILGVAYATVVCALLWSIRAGVPIMGSLVVFLLGGLIVVSEGGSGVLPQLRTVARPLFILSIVIGFVATIVRVGATG